MLKKITRSMLACVLGFYALTPAIQAQEMDIAATDYRIQYQGRINTDWQHQQVTMNWPGSQIAFQFEGRQVAIWLNGQGSQFDLLINGERKQTIKTSWLMQRYELLNTPHANKVEIRLVKRTESPGSLVTIRGLETQGRVEGIWGYRPHILFIGDSISAGYAAESNQRECTWQEIENSSNARIAYPMLTAQQLGATHSQVSYSGLGLLRNWEGNASHHNLTHYFDKAAAIYQGSTEYIDKMPQLIVLQAGNNDFSSDLQPGEPWTNPDQLQKDWQAHYIAQVNQLRQRYGQHTPIIVVSTYIWPHDRLTKAVDAVEAHFASINQPVHRFILSASLEGCQWHPTASDHQSIAQALATLIESKHLLPAY